MYITGGKMLGGGGLFLENGSVSERGIYRALIVHIVLSKKRISTKLHSIRFFTINQYYTLALSLSYN